MSVGAGLALGGRLLAGSIAVLHAVVLSSERVWARGWGVAPGTRCRGLSVLLPDCSFGLGGWAKPQADGGGWC